jgi:hypothetical protein
VLRINELTTLDSIVDPIGEGLHDHVNEHKNLHFDSDGDVDMNSENYEERCYNLDLNLRVLYLRGSGPIVKSIHLRPIHINGNKEREY